MSDGMFPPKRRDWIAGGRKMQVGVFVRTEEGAVIRLVNDVVDDSNRKSTLEMIGDLIRRKPISLKGLKSINSVDRNGRR